MLQFDVHFIFIQCSYRELHVMKCSRRRRRTNEMADLQLRAAQLRIVTPLKRHFATKCTLYVHVHRVFS